MTTVISMTPATREAAVRAHRIPTALHTVPWPQLVIHAHNADKAAGSRQVLGAVRGAGVGIFGAGRDLLAARAPAPARHRPAPLPDRINLRGPQARSRQQNTLTAPAVSADRRSPQHSWCAQPAPETWRSGRQTPARSPTRSSAGCLGTSNRSSPRLGCHSGLRQHGRGCAGQDLPW